MVSRQDAEISDGTRKAAAVTDREQTGNRYEPVGWRYRQGNGPWNYTEDQDAIQADLADEVERVYRRLRTALDADRAGQGE